MGYGNESWIQLPLSGNGDIQDSLSTDLLGAGYQLQTISNAETFAVFIVGGYPKVTLKRVGFLITAAMTSGGVIKVWKNAKDTGTLLATLTLGATAVNKNAYEDPSSIILDAGDQIIFELDVQDTGSGTGYPYVMVEPVSETPANVSDMVAV